MRDVRDAKAFVISNPGTGPVAGSSARDARRNIGAFCRELSLGAPHVHIERRANDDSDDRYSYVIRRGIRTTEVDMPGLSLDCVALRPGDNETWAIDDALQQGIPIEATVWISSLGLHAVLFVPGRDARRKPCAVALGLIRPKATANKHPEHEYVRRKISVAQLLADHCFPIGNPNRRFQALIPTRASRRTRQRSS